MRGSEEIVRAAIASSYGRALEWASRALRGNGDIVLAAVALDERALQFAGPELRADAAFMTTVAAQNPRVTHDTVAAQAHLERLKKKRRQWNDSRAAENRKHARKETKRHAQESTPPGDVSYWQATADVRRGRVYCGENSGFAALGGRTQPLVRPTRPQYARIGSYKGPQPDVRTAERG